MWFSNVSRLQTFNAAKAQANAHCRDAGIAGLIACPTKLKRQPLCNDPHVVGFAA